jgi:hypothetical protein
MGDPMRKSVGTKSTVHSLNAPTNQGSKGVKGPDGRTAPTAGSQGDRDGKGDIQAKKANTSSSKKSASK